MEYFEPPKRTQLSRIDLFLAAHGSKFLTYRIEDVKRILEPLTEEQFQLVLAQDYKEPGWMLLISLFAGTIGVDRFVLNEVGLGVLKLLTCGGMGIWTIVDWFLVQENTREYNFKLLNQAIAFSR